MKDIKSALYDNIDWSGPVWTDQTHSDVNYNNSLISLRKDNETKNKIIDIYTNPNEVPNKGVMCFGRKESGESNVSKALIQYRQKEKELKEIMTTLQKNDDREEFNTNLGLYSMWSN